MGGVDITLLYGIMKEINENFSSCNEVVRHGLR